MLPRHVRCLLVLVLYFIFIYIYVCVCVCVCMYVYIYIYIYIYIYEFFIFYTHKGHDFFFLTGEFIQNLYAVWCKACNPICKLTTSPP
jgi:hypothetical protein